MNSEASFTFHSAVEIFERKIERVADLQFVFKLPRVKMKILITIRTVLLATVMMTIECRWMPRTTRRPDDCSPEIVALKRTRVVPVAVPVKATSEPMKKYQVQYTGEEYTHPLKYDNQEQHEEVYEPTVSHAPVYNTYADGEEEEDDDDEEDDHDDEEETHAPSPPYYSPHDTAIAEHVTEGDTHHIGNGYKRRKDGKSGKKKTPSKIVLKPIASPPK